MTPVQAEAVTGGHGGNNPMESLGFLVVAGVCLGVVVKMLGEQIAL